MEHLEDTNSQLRKRTQDLRDEIENLRLEIDNRPTMRQWSQKVSEVTTVLVKPNLSLMIMGIVLFG
jgi:hypothetical protein